MVGCGESSQPSGGVDMNDTASESPNPSESVDMAEVNQEAAAIAKRLGLEDHYAKIIVDAEESDVFIDEERLIVP